jgi:hypothetical protein
MADFIIFVGYPHSHLRLGTKSVLMPICRYSASGPMPEQWDRNRGPDSARNRNMMGSIDEKVLQDLRTSLTRSKCHDGRSL